MLLQLYIRDRERERESSFPDERRSTSAARVRRTLRRCRARFAFLSRYVQARAQVYYIFTTRGESSCACSARCCSATGHYIYTYTTKLLSVIYIFAQTRRRVRKLAPSRALCPLFTTPPRVVYLYIHHRQLFIYPALYKP